MMKLKRIRACVGVVFGLIVALSAGPSICGQEKATPLLVLISVDGLRPDYIAAADQHGGKVPTLKRFLKEGAYAEGVTRVVSTVTYPSHTTLMTGVWPAKHGIWANTTFDPLQKNYQGWYRYAEDTGSASGFSPDWARCAGGERFGRD